MTICTLAFLHIKNSRCATLRNHKLPWMIYQYSSPQKCVLTIFINTISAFTLPPSIDHKFNLWPFRTFQYIISIDSQFFQWYIVFNACRLIWFVDPSCLKKLGSSCVCRGITLLFSLLISTVCAAIRRIFFW